MSAQKAPQMLKTAKRENTKFDQMLEAWQAGKEVDWTDLLAAWVEAPPATRSAELLVKVIQSVGAK